MPRAACASDRPPHRAIVACAEPESFTEPGTSSGCLDSPARGASPARVAGGRRELLPAAPATPLRRAPLQLVEEPVVLAHAPHRSSGLRELERVRPPSPVRGPPYGTPQHKLSPPPHSGANGKYASIIGACEYDVDCLAVEWLVLVAQCAWYLSCERHEIQNIVSVCGPHSDARNRAKALWRTGRAVTL